MVVMHSAAFFSYFSILFSKPNIFKVAHEKCAYLKQCNENILFTAFPVGYLGSFCCHVLLWSGTCTVRGWGAAWHSCGFMPSMPELLPSRGWALGHGRAVIRLCYWTIRGGTAFVTIPRSIRENHNSSRLKRHLLSIERDLLGIHRYQRPDFITEVTSEPTPESSYCMTGLISNQKEAWDCSIKTFN